MDIAALIVAIVALLFAVSAAGFGVYIQFQTYKATTDHLRSVEASVSGFRTEMQGLVGELKGMTHTLVEAQQQQFNRMLDAFVTRPGAAAEVAERTGESAETLQQISDAMEALKEEIRHAASADEVQHKLDELAGRLEAVSAATSRAARMAEAAAQPGVTSERAESHEFPVGQVEAIPHSVPRGGSVMIEPVVGMPWRAVEKATCIVVSPKGRRSIRHWRADNPERPKLRFFFPNDFPEASADETGWYGVWIQLRILDRVGTVRGSFRVVEADNPQANGQPDD